MQPQHPPPPGQPTYPHAHPAAYPPAPQFPHGHAHPHAAPVGYAAPPPKKRNPIVLLAILVAFVPIALIGTCVVTLVMSGAGFSDMAKATMAACAAAGDDAQCSEVTRTAPEATAGIRAALAHLEEDWGPYQSLTATGTCRSTTMDATIGELYGKVEFENETEMMVFVWTRDGERWRLTGLGPRDRYESTCS